MAREVIDSKLYTLLFSGTSNKRSVDLTRILTVLQQHTQTGSCASDEIERDCIYSMGKEFSGSQDGEEEWSESRGEKEDFTSLVVIDRKRLPLKAVA
jgi:hypothetical protein